MVGIFVRTFPSSKTVCSVKLNNHIIIVIILQYSLKFQTLKQKMRSAIIKLKTKLMNKIAFSVTPKMPHSTEPFKTPLFKLL